MAYLANSARLIDPLFRLDLEEALAAVRSRIETMRKTRLPSRKRCRVVMSVREPQMQMRCVTLRAEALGLNLTRGRNRRDRRP